MSREDLDRFLTDASRRAVDRFMQESSDESDDFDVAEALDRNLYEAMQRYDNRAALSRRLELRFLGPHTNGRLAEDALEDILKAFRHEISGASASKEAGSLRLDLVGFSQGSAILHFAPADSARLSSGDAPEESQQSLTAEEDPIDHALSVITELHGTVEQSGDLLRFAGQEKLLRGFAALTDALDKHDLDMGITWRNRTGLRRSSLLTLNGRTHARQYLNNADSSEIIVISGRVIELSISGSFDIKTGNAKNSPRYKILVKGGEETLLSLRLELGQSITARIRKRTENNQLGLTSNPRYELLKIQATEDPLI